jgi:hypothetical protein
MDRFASDCPTPEEALLINEARKEASASLKKIRDHFAGDSDVETILMGIEEEDKPEVIRQAFGMSITQYETGRKRLRRGLERLFPKRTKS